jgi:hypothetical protein
VLKGKNLLQQIDVAKLMPDKKDQNFVSTAGVFWLYQKFHTLEKLNFYDPKTKKAMSGLEAGTILDEKNKNIALYGAFLLVTLTKNLKLLYCNLDQFFFAKTAEECPFNMTTYDKIYGQQSHIVATKQIPVANKIK